MLCKQHDKSSVLNSTHYAVLYPQNGDRIVATDSVTSVHPMYRPAYAWSALLHADTFAGKQTRGRFNFSGTVLC